MKIFRRKGGGAEGAMRALEGAAESFEANRTPEERAELARAAAHNREVLRKAQADLAKLGVKMDINF